MAGHEIAYLGLLESYENLLLTVTTPQAQNALDFSIAF